MFTSPFLYLFACSLKNRILRRLRRLRQPKYAIGAVVGLAYFYLVFFHRVRYRSRGRFVPGVAAAPLPAAVLARVQIAVTLAGTFILWLVVLARWFVPVSSQPLQVSAPERDVLLAAPVARRRIMRYKLIRSFAGILFGTAIMVLFARGAVGNTWSFLVGTFLLFTTMRLHLLGIALSRRSLFSRSGRRDLAAAVALGVVAVATVAAVSALVPAIVRLRTTDDLEASFNLFRNATSHGAIALALLPFSMIVRPIFAEWPGPFLGAALPVVAVALLNYRWVLRAESVLEDSVETAEREVAAGRRAAPRPVTRRAPFALALRGRPEIAILWKNLILIGRYASLTMLIRVAAPLVALALMAGAKGHSRAVASFLPVVIAVGFGLTVLGPYSFRNDLRQDLARLPVLKTWPVSGERLMWGEVLAPVIATTLVVWLLTLVAGALSLSVPVATLPWRSRVAFGIAAALVCPALILGQVVVQNAAVVLFPGWIATGPNRPRGVEAMGQQMLMFAGTLLLLALGVLPGALFGGGVLLVGYAFVGWVALVPAALMLTALLLAEAVLALHFLGGVLDRTDPTAVEAAS